MPNKILGADLRWLAFHDPPDDEYPAYPWSPEYRLFSIPLREAECRATIFLWI